MPPKQILIVDDNKAVRTAVRGIFANQDDLEICGEALDGKDAIEKAAQLHPDLIILDLSMPVMNGLDAARVLQRTSPAVPLILYTLYADRALESEASAIGIRAVVAKENMVGLVGQARALLKPLPH